ncbi:hypothetical protein [Streptoalloteichus hindustanus]|uniref:hypothetical protein n=1 Tax=Streptoalloteichus hindustanus TaxID=2017 RepID=UPI0009358D39|nr:hypothetical protein [Streptoalloteichus hindustanus]
MFASVEVEYDRAMSRAASSASLARASAISWSTRCRTNSPNDPNRAVTDGTSTGSGRALLTCDSSSRCSKVT